MIIKPRKGAPLTKRELEVAPLVAEGLSNKLIADRLNITESTAHYHIEQIRTKVGASNRVQVAVWWVSKSWNAALTAYRKGSVDELLSVFREAVYERG